MAHAVLVLLIMLVAFGVLSMVSNSRLANPGTATYRSHYLLRELVYDMKHLKRCGSRKNVPNRPAPGGPDGQHHK